MQRLKSPIHFSIGIGLSLFVWWFVASRVSAFVVPSPTTTAAALHALVINKDFWSDTIFPTLIRAFVGGANAAFIGITLGVLAGRFALLDGILEPPRLFLSAIPAPVFVILALLWVGVDDITIVLTVAVMLIPLFYVAARDGLRGSDQALLEMAQVYRFTGLQIWQFIQFPAVLISLIPASRVAIANALRLTILAEILVSAGGIGEEISMSRQYLETDKLFAFVILLVTFIGLLELAMGHWLPDRK